MYGDCVSYALGIMHRFPTFIHLVSDYDLQVHMYTNTHTQCNLQHCLPENLREHYQNLP